MKWIAMICLLMLGITSKGQTGYQVGALASDFSLKNVDGKNVALSDYKNAKGYILVFTCNTCPVAKAYQSRVEELHQLYAAKGYPVLAINTNDPVASPGDGLDQMKALVNEKKIAYPYLSDPDHLITKKFGAQRTPHVFVLQKTTAGNEVAYIGAIDNDQSNENPEKQNYVRNAVDALLASKKPSVTTTKAIGCSIEWKKEVGK